MRARLKTCSWLQKREHLGFLISLLRFGAEGEEEGVGLEDVSSQTSEMKADYYNPPLMFD